MTLQNEMCVRIILQSKSLLTLKTILDNFPCCGSILIKLSNTRTWISIQFYF